MNLKLHTPSAVLLAALVLYVVYCGAMYLLQRRIIFPGTSLRTPQGLASDPSNIERIWVEAGDTRVEAWLLPARPGRERSPAIIFAHGNLELIDLWPETLGQLTDLGLHVLLVEYPGYGRSVGSPSQTAVAESFAAAYDWLVGRDDVDASRIVLMGRSLGGGAVCALAELRPSAALILMSTFSSLRSLSWRFLAPGFLVRDPFDNIAVVRGYAGPVLVVHGSRDGLIPFSHGRRLARAARNGRIIGYDADHNDCPPDWEVVLQDVEAFLTESSLIPQPD